MTGRQETQERLESIVRKKLIGKPQYLIDYSKTFGDKTAVTKRDYINYIVDFLNYLEKELNYDISNVSCFKDVKTSTLNGYSEYIRYRIVKNEKGESIKKENGERIRASRIYAIKDFFKFLYIDRYIDYNPSLEVSIPKNKNEIQVVALTEEEVQMLKQNILSGVGSSKAIKRQAIWKNRDLAIVMIGLVTGLRVESIVEINVSDIDFKSYSINVVEKGNKLRTCYIGQNTMNILEDWLEDRSWMLNVDPNGDKCEALFLSSIKKNGSYTRITTSGVGKLIRKYTQNIDKHITPHKLRSTCATTTYKHTGDIYLTASVLGHKNIQNTRRYAAVADSERKTTATKLDNIFG